LFYRFRASGVETAMSGGGQGGQRRGLHETSIEVEVLVGRDLRLPRRSCEAAKTVVVPHGTAGTPFPTGTGAPTKASVFDQTGRRGGQRRGRDDGCAVRVIQKKRRGPEIQNLRAGAGKQSEARMEGSCRSHSSEIHSNRRAMGYCRWGASTSRCRSRPYFLIRFQTVTRLMPR